MGTLTILESARWRIVAIAVVLLAGLVSAGCSSRGRSASSASRAVPTTGAPTPPTPEARLRAAQAALLRAKSVAFFYTLTTRSGDQTFAALGDATMDLANGRSRVEATFPGLAIIKDIYPGGIVEEVIEGRTLYIRTPPALRGASDGHAWFAVPRRNTGDALGDTALSGDIRGLFDLAVATATTVTDEGYDDQIKGHRVIVDLSAAAIYARNGRTPPPGFPPTMRLLAYLGVDDLPVQIQLAVRDTNGNGVTFSGSMSNYDEPVSVPVVAAADAFPVANQNEAFQRIARAAGYALAS